MYIVKNGKSNGKVFILKDAEKELDFVCGAFCGILQKITGVKITCEVVDCISDDFNGVAFILDKGVEKGFLVEKVNSLVTVSASNVADVYFGAIDLIEKNCEIIFSRGAIEEQFAFSKNEDFELKICDYQESSPFKVRSFNICGTGTDGRQHADDGTVQYMSLNKTNAITHYFDERWREYGLTGSALHFSEINNVDDLIEEHPEYFMTAPDGSAMKALGGHDSFMNYYNPDIAKVFASRLVDLKNKIDVRNDVIWVMPDNPYFNMVVDGVELNEQPFTADDGTVVYPNEKEYKSTVYFNFLNRVMEEANKLRPNTELIVFAYTYSETAPKIKVHPCVRVMLAPITANDKYAYTVSNESNKAIRENIEAWAKKTDKLGIYTYWCSFKGTIYSRPILDVVKENLKWFRSLGVYQIIIEGKVDCSLSANLTAAQKGSTKFYDMNEAFIWAMQKLMWNPDENVDKLLEKYCKIVYKECAKEMNEYFSLLKKGWDSTDAMVWYTTGGDIYYLQFVINSGLADKVLSVLKTAVKKANENAVKRKVVSIYETVSEQVERYKNFVKEDAYVLRFDGYESELLSETSLNYLNNPNSVWNKAKSLTCLRDYENLQFYPEQAKFSCKMIYDDNNIYVGYTVFDDMIERQELSADGTLRVYRKDGSELISYTETYIGGNVFNQSVYYGYISGFNGDREKEGQFYENAGVPKRKPIPLSMRDVKFVKTDGDEKERYYFHVQVIPISALGAKSDAFYPYGSFVYYSDRFGRAGWMGYGLWSKQNFSRFILEEKILTDKGEENG